MIKSVNETSNLMLTGSGAELSDFHERTDPFFPPIWLFSPSVLKTIARFRKVHSLLRLVNVHKMDAEKEYKSFLRGYKKKWLRLCDYLDRARSIQRPWRTKRKPSSIDYSDSELLHFQVHVISLKVELFFFQYRLIGHLSRLLRHRPQSARNESKATLYEPEFVYLSPFKTFFRGVKVIGRAPPSRRLIHIS